jgi:glycosyltransferase involved in cell wall biosynthesis
MTNNKKKKNKKTKLLPFVSICTPTFNRRPFISYMIKCFEHQTYPKDRMEWIIVDDGTDPIGDLVSHIPQVKYISIKDKMSLGKKRNFMHSQCKGDILVYMDDDDYYPPERVSHAVETLMDNPRYLIAGSSQMYIYFDSRNKIYQFGPYGENHATAATFAFRKELLAQTSYVDDALLAEEKHFLKSYTIPLKQLDPGKTILVFSHKHNTLNKEKLLENPEATRAVVTNYILEEFIKDPLLRHFYMTDMNNVLENYEPGRPENKPKLLEQIKKMEEERQKRLDDHNKMLEARQKIMNNLQNTNPNTNLTHPLQQVLPTANEIELMRINYEKQLSDKNYLINELLKKLKEVTQELDRYRQAHAQAQAQNTI